MKSIVLSLIIALSTSQAMALDCTTPECLGAKAVIDVLNYNGTPSDAKELLVAALNGETNSINTVILSNQLTEGQNGQATRAIQIGVDDLTDDDQGWGTVYQITVTTLDGKILDVVLVPIAG